MHHKNCKNNVKKIAEGNQLMTFFFCQYKFKCLRCFTNYKLIREHIEAYILNVLPYNKAGIWQSKSSLFF